jgi:hypothetical protein
MLHALPYHPPVTSFLVGPNILPSALFSNSSAGVPIAVLWVKTLCNLPDCTVSQVARPRYVHFRLKTTDLTTSVNVLC